MNIITALFCILPLAIGLSPLVPLIARLTLDVRKAQKQIDLRNMQLAEAQRKTARHEAEIAERWNKVTLQELEIEKRRREMGMDVQEFTPRDYPQ